MTDTWETTLAQGFDAAFGATARSGVAARDNTSTWDSAGELTQHLQLANQVFETIALVLSRGTASSTVEPSPSRQVFDKLLPQIAQDIKGVNRLVVSGFPYQAVAVAGSAFEHGVMLASIGNDDARAKKWLSHTSSTRNSDSVQKTVELALDNLDRDFPGLKAQLQDPYKGMYGPLCAFKHGNPLVQQHVQQKTSGGLPLSIFAPADRRAIIAAFWAIEAAIRAAWFALISFIRHHLPRSVDLEEIVRGVNRAANTVVQKRQRKEQEPN
jgi:hypothetical protein